MLEKIFYGTGFGRERMSAARAGYLLLIWVVIPTWLVTVYFNLLVSLAFNGAFSMAGEKFGLDISFRHPRLEWTGDISLENLSVRPLEPDPARPMSLFVRRIRIDMPNWGVMQSLAASGNDNTDGESHASVLKVIDRMDHVGLQLEGMQFDLAKGLPGVLSHVGLSSAAPLEAEGCQGDNMWVASELPKLGIANDGIDVQLTLANAPEEHEVHVTGQLRSPHSSRAAFAQHFRAPSLSAFLEAPPGTRIATYERVAIDDDGFIAARDAFCAKRDGVALEDFRERHIAAVRRLLETNGMRPTPELEAVYRRYLDKGQLVLEAHPSGTIRREDYNLYSVADQVRIYNGTLSAGGKPLPLQFDEVRPRAIPQSFRGSTWDLVAAETHLPAETTAIAAAATPAPVAPAAIAAAVPVAPPPRASSLPQAPAAATPVPKLAAAAAPAWAIPAGTTRTTADGRPLASSLPQASAKRTGPKTLEYGELPQHVGERLEITTIYGEHHAGRLVSVSGQAIQLRMSIAVGYAITNFERGNIRLIRDMD